MNRADMHMLMQRLADTAVVKARADADAEKARLEFAQFIDKAFPMCGASVFERLQIAENNLAAAGMEREALDSAVKRLAEIADDYILGDANSYDLRAALAAVPVAWEPRTIEVVARFNGGKCGYFTDGKRYKARLILRGGHGYEVLDDHEHVRAMTPDERTAHIKDRNENPVGMFERVA